MKELLSNEEIDSLLELFRAESGVAEPPGEVLDPAVAPAAQGSPLDLLKPNRFGRERLQMLERLFASIAKSIGAALGERLRLDVVCDCVSVEQVRFASWRRQIDGPVGIWTVAMPPFASPLLLTMAGGLLRSSVDRLLGGSGRVDRAEEAFTAAELAVAEALVETLVERITAGFGELVAVRPRIDARSGNPAMVQAMAPTEVALAVYLQVSGEVLHGDLWLTVAYQDLEPHLDSAPEARDEEGQAFREAERVAVGRAVRGVPLGLSVVLGETAISLRSLLDLRCGDVVRLERLCGAPLEARVEGVGRFRGRTVRHGSARAFRVEEVIGEDDDEDG
jgi:flagellar motor switch protein FliN/FliY